MVWIGRWAGESQFQRQAGCAPPADRGMCGSSPNKFLDAHRDKHRLSAAVVQRIGIFEPVGTWKCVGARQCQSRVADRKERAEAPAPRSSAWAGIWLKCCSAPLRKGSSQSSSDAMMRASSSMGRPGRTEPLSMQPGEPGGAADRRFLRPWQDARTDAARTAAMRSPRSASSPVGAGSVLRTMQSRRYGWHRVLAGHFGPPIVGHLPAADDAGFHPDSARLTRYLRSGKNARAPRTPGEISDNQPWRFRQRCGGVDLAATTIRERELAIAARLGDPVGVGADEQAPDTVRIRRSAAILRPAVSPTLAPG